MQQNEMKYLGVKNGERLREFDTLMEAECQHGIEKNGQHHSRHEALAILEEEIYEDKVELECMEYLFKQLKEMVFKDNGSMPIQKTLDEIDRTAARGMLEVLQAGAMAKKFAQYMQEE